MGTSIIRSFSLLIVLLAATFRTAYPQTPTTCAVTAVPPTVHSEGLTERLGDIVLTCTGSPGATVAASLTVFLPVSITNRIDTNSFATDATLTVNTGSGPVPAGASGLVANQSISFNGFSFTLPASGIATLILDDLRADVNQLGLQQQAPIQASLGGNLALTNNPVVVAFAQPGLLASSASAGVRCEGSPVPSTISLSNLFADGTSEATTRITEGFAQAFEPKDPTSDTGTRILLTYSNFPAGTTIYVPDAVAGSSATLPTSGGDLGTAAAVGQYTPGSGTLLLVRVLNTDDNGVGGTLATLPPANASGVLVLNPANPVSLANGAGYAVYEIVDANPSARESAQIPSFFGVPANTPPAVANLSVSLAPVSTVTTASTTAPIPRFAAVQPPSDCATLGDCNASYFPQLQVTAQPIQVSAAAGGKRVAAGEIIVANLRSGVLDWSATVTYTRGAGWLVLSQASGIDGANIGVFADVGTLSPGVYQASVLIDAGPMAGSQSIPVTLTVTAAIAVPTSVPTSVTVSAVTDAADFHAGPVVPGSLAAVFGTNLSGQNVSVTFDGIAARLLYTGATQINLQIPPDLTGHSSSQMVVTVDGSSSAPVTVQLVAIAPALFTPGILNQDNTLNSPTNPASAGSILQIFGTGMPASGGAVLVTIGTHANMIPLYAGAAPGLPGIEQVNVAVPSGLGVTTANLTICVTGTGSQRYCSQPEAIALH
jgi:uncharacterized protein (TIGR03437 family)